ncbi:MAG TPA: transcriptional regulator [Terracidiphilus sp.]
MRVTFRAIPKTYRFAPVALYFLMVACLHASLQAQTLWSTVGPDGGDARAFAAVPGQPNHLYLGTTNSWIFESTDEGATWHRLAKLDKADDLVIDHIVVDPRKPAHLYVAAWKFGHPDGGLWVSTDAGRTWNPDTGLSGQSIRAFTPAPSDPATLFAGTLEGVFRSTDSGATWKLISPPGSKEIHEVESLAVDPKDPNIVYAGTWHLPWKTSDGGNNWENIKQGVIDDSDVFSIIVDPQSPNVVYASACSGIYRSTNGAGLFKKVQGIPSTARRTRVLRQDPVHHDTVYAGTTEGLYKTTDAGKTFQRMTGPEVIVNDVFIDPKNPERVLLATDRGGVLSSNDAAVTFKEANQGFSARKVEALLVDPSNALRVYAGVVNDKTYGGAFVSDDGGTRWKHIGEGLEGRDVFALAQSPDGVVVAGTNSGIFVLDSTSETWKSRNTIANTIAKPTPQLVRGKHVIVDKKVKAPLTELGSRVYELDLSGDVWLAATAGGLFTSKDKGATWQGGPAVGSVDFLSVTAHGSVLAAARPTGVVISNDAGQTWWPMGVPTALTRIHRAAFSSDGTLWVGAREGVYFTRDKGKTWMWVHRLPLVGVDDLFYDVHANRILVSSRDSDFVYSIDAKSLDWKWLQTGFHLSLVRAAGDRLLAASLDDGVLAEPQGAKSEVGQK